MGWTVGNVARCPSGRDCVWTVSQDATARAIASNVRDGEGQGSIGVSRCQCGYVGLALVVPGLPPGTAACVVLTRDEAEDAADAILGRMPFEEA